MDEETKIRKAIRWVSGKLRAGAGAASTALAGYAVSRAAAAGFDIDQTAVEVALVPAGAWLVLQVENYLLRKLPKLGWLITLVRFGSSPAVYEHQADDLEALAEAEAFDT